MGPKLSTCRLSDEGDEQQCYGEGAQPEEEKGRKLHHAHLDGDELIAPEQRHQHRAGDLNERHGILILRPIGPDKGARITRSAVDRAELPDETVEKSVRQWLATWLALVPS
jgi:hypothetical protein